MNTHAWLRDWAGKRIGGTRTNAPCSRRVTHVCSCATNAQRVVQAAAANVGILARVPLASGLLTGKFTVESIQPDKFQENDHRRFNRLGECFDAGETW